MSKPSGKFVLRITPAIHQELKEQARSRGLSLNQLCSEKLAGRTKNESIIDAIRSKWKSQLIGVVLFGSTVRGESTSKSDLDLLIVLAETAQIDRALYTEWDELRLPSKYSPQFVKIPLEPLAAGGLWYEVALDGVVLWEKDLEISRFLSKIRSAIAEGKLRRSVSHGHPYWKKVV